MRAVCPLQGLFQWSLESLTNSQKQPTSFLSKLIRFLQNLTSPAIAAPGGIITEHALSSALSAIFDDSDHSPSNYEQTNLRTESVGGERCAVAGFAGVLTRLNLAFLAAPTLTREKEKLSFNLFSTLAAKNRFASSSHSELALCQSLFCPRRNLQFRGGL